MDKVVIPKEVALAIETLRTKNVHNAYIIFKLFGIDLRGDFKTIQLYVREQEENYDNLLKALVNGYIIE